MNVVRLPVEARQALTRSPQSIVIEPEGEDLFFPVKLVPAAARIGNTFLESDYQAVVRLDTNQVLAVHGPGYNLIENREVFGAFDEALSQSVLDKDGMYWKDELANNGARSVRTYVFPAHSFRIGRSDDVVDLRVQVINSYDGSMAFTTLVGGYRLICTNGMVIGKTFAHTYTKHTKGFELGTILERIDNAIEIYAQNAREWHRWTDRTITDVQVNQVIATLPGNSERLTNNLMDYYQNEKRHLGPTLWALFNALTYWSSHEKVKTTSAANRPGIVLNRENRVRTVLNSEPFQRLAT